MRNSNTSGYSDVLIGLQYGDEGKAKIIDSLAPNYDVVARFNGGVNAGHTIVTNRGKLALRQVPSAVEYPDCKLYIGSGCVISAAPLLAEILQITNAGLDIKNRLKISPHASLVLPHHIVLDKIHGGNLGTTGNGIGPAYADRAFRLRDGVLANVRMIDIKNDPKMVLDIAKIHLDSIKSEAGEFYDLGLKLLEELASAAPSIGEFVHPTNDYLVKQLHKGARVLFEGAQSFMLDVVHGDVPYVTSSLTGVSAAYTGGDVPPTFHRYSFGIVKLVMSRVGLGPFPSEFGGDKSNDYCTQNGGNAHTRDYEKENFNADDLMRSGDDFKTGQALRMFSGEYGTGSGRPRRIGMLDLAQLNSAVETNGIDFLFLTKCDCLRDFAKTPEVIIPIVHSYEESGKPIIKGYAAFDQELDSCKNFSELPKGLSEIISDIENLSGSNVMGIGVGPHRDQMILSNGGKLSQLKIFTKTTEIEEIVSKTSSM